MQRIKQYNLLSTSLACISNEKLKQILVDAKPIHQGIGGKSALISIDDRPVFIKKIPLTDFEQLPQHFMSTANIFDLPLNYQYRLGSAGFGVWRELVSHIMTTNWVITGECTNFPIMYHWRILPSCSSDMNTNGWCDIEEYCEYWEHSDAIRKRIEELNKASKYIALFLEYIPQNLSEWLNAQIAKDDGCLEDAVVFVDEQLKKVNNHMNGLGFMHFDAHFENILSDGERLYFSDFGLALSSKFDLSEEEKEFLRLHQSYDQAWAAANLLHFVTTLFFGKEYCEISMLEYLTRELIDATSLISAMIKQYTPITLCMDEFFEKLRKESKSTPYPTAQLEKLLSISSYKRDKMIT
jgi:hypothetical protein